MNIAPVPPGGVMMVARRCAGFGYYNGYLTSCQGDLRFEISNLRGLRPAVYFFWVRRGFWHDVNDESYAKWMPTMKIFNDSRAESRFLLPYGHTWIITMNCLEIVGGRGSKFRQL